NLAALEEAQGDEREHQGCETRHEDRGHARAGRAPPDPGSPPSGGGCNRRTRRPGDEADDQDRQRRERGETSRRVLGLPLELQSGDEPVEVAGLEVEQARQADARNRHQGGPGQDLQPGPLAVMLPGMEPEGQAEHDADTRQADTAAEAGAGSATEVAKALRWTDACVTSKSADRVPLRAEDRHEVPTLCRPGEVSPGMDRPAWSTRPAASGRADPMRMPLKDTPTSPQD